MTAGATIDDVGRIDVRVGTVTRAEPFPEARRPAIKLWIDFGPEVGTRPSSAQVVARYEPEALVGRQVLAVVNLPPRRIGPFVFGGSRPGPAGCRRRGRPAGAGASGARRGADALRLLISRALPESVMAAARAAFDVEVRDTTRPMDVAECRAALARADVIVPTLGDAFEAAAFDGPIRARGLANFGVGTNHIDADVARAAGLVVTNTPGAVTDATADVAVTLMLMAARRAGEGERLVRAGAWEGWHPTQMLGLHVTGKVLGVIGMGRIGQAIAHRCRHGFGMDVVFHNRSTKAVEGARQLGSVTQVCAAADVVVVTVPATPQTHHLIDGPALAAMRPHAILVNVARGDVVDEAALIAALEARAIGGAGLDVYEEEPVVPERLRALENAVLLPHLGTATLEVREAMGRMALDNAVAIAEGREPPNPVGC